MTLDKYIAKSYYVYNKKLYTIYKVPMQKDHVEEANHGYFCVFAGGLGSKDKSHCTQKVFLRPAFEALLDPYDIANCNIIG